MSGFKLHFFKAVDSFNTGSEFSKKTFLTLKRTYTCAYQGVRNVFSEKFAYVLNE